MAIRDEKEKEPLLTKDEYTLDELMDTYGQRVLWLAFSYVKDRGLAEDITQDVFISCYKSLHQFRGESSIKTWIYRITVNRCKDVMKTWAFRSRKFTSLLFDEHEGRDKSPDTILVEKLEAHELSQHVLELPVNYREMIYLHYFEHMKIEDISTLFSLKPNTVKSRLLRGRQMLKKKYEGGGQFGR
ncbi:sigma-70 family RNA polymerase sigma factor [Fictibacillus iocasae]|uniref:Sigma-70 family RNA polymerase sigma factor n=1 Tax=Fictibacillus iocasae TaxID=2715437 RepID=A0ABW2NSN6_9BACL